MTAANDLAMLGNDLYKFEEMWTTKRAEYCLEEHVGRFLFTTGYVIVHHEVAGDLYVVIEDNDIYEEVVKRMLASGVPLITIYRTRFGRMISRLFKGIFRIQRH
jgi:hypothetical protein